MPRKPRFNLTGIPQHIVQRGNNRQPCFFAQQDYEQYLEDLNDAATHADCRIHAYVLMPNHVHLLVTPMQDQGVPSMMQSLGRRYVYYINNRYNRCGTLWQGRYKSSLVDSEHYLLACMLYIELNPVRAGLVADPANYYWSSYHANACEHGPDLISPHPVYSALAMNDTQRQARYRTLFKTAFDDETLQLIRTTLNHELVLGSTEFRNMIEKQTRRQTRLGHPGRPRVQEQPASYII